MQAPLVIRDDEILNGTPVFFETRVPIQTLIDYLTAGDSIDEFLDDFPTVTREQATRFLEVAGEYMIANADENSR